MTAPNGSSLTLARAIALGVPALLLGGAYLSQYGFGLYPCEMCWWQRYPHFAALAFGLLAFVAEPKRLWVALAALAVLASGAIGVLHAGVEYGWWQGVTTCSGGGALDSSMDPLEAIMAAPLIRCDSAPWTLAGVSLAGFNAIFSIAAALTVFALLRKGRTA